MQSGRSKSKETLLARVFVGYQSRGTGISITGMEYMQVTMNIQAPNWRGYPAIRMLGTLGLGSKTVSFLQHADPS